MKASKHHQYRYKTMMEQDIVSVVDYVNISSNNGFYNILINDK